MSPRITSGTNLRMSPWVVGKLFQPKLGWCSFFWGGLQRYKLHVRAALSRGYHVVHSIGTTICAYLEHGCKRKTKNKTRTFWVTTHYKQAKQHTHKRQKFFLITDEICITVGPQIPKLLREFGVSDYQIPTRRLSLLVEVHARRKETCTVPVNLCRWTTCECGKT